MIQYLQNRTALRKLDPLLIIPTKTPTTLIPHTFASRKHHSKAEHYSVEAERTAETLDIDISSEPPRVFFHRERTKGGQPPRFRNERRLVSQRRLT